MPLILANDFGTLWRELVKELHNYGVLVNPRGFPCYEITNMQLELTDARSNIFVNDVRKLNYRFMVAEWLWIWFGHDDVSTITRYNKVISKFSDDGEKFFGAYGPRLRLDWDAAVSALKKDPDTRQAIISLWRNPRSVCTKDVPCTLAVQFLRRDMKLHTTVTMRSSDVWLGLPYDMFTFSMLGNIMAAVLGVHQGSITFNLGSSHLYDSNSEAASKALNEHTLSYHSPRLTAEPPAWLDSVLTNKELPNVTMVNQYMRYASALVSIGSGQLAQHFIVEEE